ncbi:hypothetical protein MVEN_00923200 [Mycena venus]|uniref:Uncharacterized protein n=1 Tax=Mycena venus TaxID=2733690 RepID=A0A8H6YDB3_9AGAR|nr:hypothetical protein MVEN_00923200 [Mycena venus]
MFSLLMRLFCCGARPRTPPDVQSTVIPNEHSRLLDDDESPAVVVDHQTLDDRLVTIVRAKEGKMVSVSARTPFILHDAEQEQLPSTSNASAGGVQTHVNVSRRPPVLTMTPARAQSQGSLNLHSDTYSQSRHSSHSGSRSSSRQPPALRSQSTHSSNSAHHSTTSGPASTSASDTRAGKALDANEWFVESESEFSAAEDEPSSGATPTATAQPAAVVRSPPADMRGIAFDWDD